MKKRLYWVDNLKGLGIIAIVLGHCNFPKENIFVQYLFSFHVAIFFLISGLLFHDHRYISFKKFIKEKFKRLVIPYFAFNLINYVIVILGNRKLDVNPSQFIFNTLRGIYIGEGMQNLYNIPTWFLPCLFFVSVYYFLINKYIKNKKVKILVLFLLSIIVYIESRLAVVRFPLNLEIALMGTLFYGIGHTFNKGITSFAESISKKNLLVVPFIIFLNFIFLNKTNMSANYYGNYGKFLICSFLGGLTLLIFSKSFNNIRVLSYLGKNSIIIIGMEWIKTIVLKYFSIVSFGLVKNEFGIATGFIQGILCLIVLIPTIFIIDNYFPFIIGKVPIKQYVVKSKC